jgi:hypothetical protein
MEGRPHRLHESKRAVTIYDYVEEGKATLTKMAVW